MTFIIVAVLGVLIPVLAYIILRDRLEWRISALAAVICLATASAFWYGARSGLMTDVEIWNGKVVSKSSEHVSCEHSYSCNCTTDSKGNTSCQTCYEHSYDVSWFVQTTIGEFTIDRVNRRGTEEPPRFTGVKIDEPVAREHYYKSYIKGSNSLFKEYTTDPLILAKVPEYPRVYDYYRIHRVLVNGKVKIPQKDIDLLNDTLNNGLKNIGTSKEVNVIVIFTDGPDASYIYAIQKKWIGGKKNDVVVVIGTSTYPNIEWANVFTWARNYGNENFQVVLRDRLVDLKTVDSVVLGTTILDTIVTKYDRPHNRSFEYLDNQIVPPTWAIWMAYIFVVLGNIGAVIFQLTLLDKNRDYGRFYR